MAKMTAKEFKETLNEGGYKFELSGYEGVLVALERELWLSAFEYKGKNNPSLAEYFTEKANALHKANKAHGLYND